MLLWLCCRIVFRVMSYKNFFKFFPFVLLCFLVGICCFNFFVDPFSVFCKPEYEQIKNKMIFPNERYIKMKYILANKTKYDSFLFGSCSCNFMNLKDAPYGNWYNMTYADNTMYDVRRVLELMIHSGIIPKRIIVQVSDANLKDSEDGAVFRCKQVLNYCPYPVSFNEKIRFYGLYLLSLPLYNYYVYDLWDRWIPEAKVNIFKNGAFVPGLISNPSEASKTKLDKFENVQYIHDYYKNCHLFELKKIVDICKQNSIDFTLFIVPEYFEVYKKIDLNEFSSEKKKIADITPFYDFTGINDISLNKYNFVDPVHINEWTTKLIVDRLFYEDKNEEPLIKGFGVYVTKQNIDEHIKNLENEMNNYNKTQKEKYVF